jgi:hypothetical protein
MKEGFQNLYGNGYFHRLKNISEKENRRCRKVLHQNLLIKAW